jgi:hypothetical protein
MSPLGKQAQGGDAPPGEVGAEEQEMPTGRKIDLQALADRVYKLLKQELRLERERLGWKRRW